VPEIELDPGDYRERKPKGWRWRLPWSHPEDNKLHLVVFLVCLGFALYFFANLPEGTSLGVVIGVAVFSALAGMQLILWLRD
jgi:hypothetical protein